LFAGVVAGSAICLYVLLRRSNLHPTLSAVLTLIGALAGSTAWGARPQLLNMLLTGMLLVGLGYYRRGRLSPLLLPPFIWLWANLHSGFLVGIIIAGLFLLGEWFDAYRSPTTGMPARRRKLFGWAIALLYLALASQRNVPLFVIAGAPLAGRCAQALLVTFSSILPSVVRRPAAEAALRWTPIRWSGPTVAVGVLNLALLVVAVAVMLTY